MSKSKRAKKRARSGIMESRHAPLTVIDAEAFEEARRSPALKQFLRDAQAQEERLEREGLIHP